MCTVNSLRKAIIYFLSLGTILGITTQYGKVYANIKYSSSAHLSAFNTTVIAPSDRVVEIKTNNSCDTTINIPPAAIGLMPGCPLYSITTSSSFQTLNSNGGSMNFYTGIYNIVYCVTDFCRTTICDTMILVVLDSEKPNMVCAPDYVVNLNSEGLGSIPASLFDGGSYDNCHHIFFKARRMNFPPNGECLSLDNPLNWFDDKVDFCCADIGRSPIQIIVRAYDVYPGDGPISPDSFYLDHYSECMVMVTVADKLGPTLWIPPDLTVSCGTDLDSLLNANTASYSDNCYDSRLFIKINKNLNACGYGTIDKEYTVIDESQLSTTKIQHFTILKNSNFNGLDTNQLRWPDHQVVYACRINVDTINAGEPIIKEDECDNVTVNKHDELYTFGQGGVCGKLLRHWQVINWCVYNRYYKPNPNVPENGYYSFVQEIKIMDTVPPVFINIRDTVLFSSATDCGSSLIILNPVQATDCNSITNLNYYYEIDLFSDNNINVKGYGQTVREVLPMGNHTVYYNVEDSCHNVTRQKSKLTIKDGKSPSIVVYYGLSTSLQMMNGRIMAMVAARLFNNKSSDNCTKAEKLRFSFSNDPNDSIKIFTCDDKGIQEFDIYVWDECNNYSTTKTFMTVLDLDNLCPTNIRTHIVEGLISTPSGSLIDKAMVQRIDSMHYEIKYSNQFGNFSFQDIPHGMSMKVEVSSNEQPMYGISTADLVAIQQHILGKKIINKSYDLLAADVDMSGFVTTADIVMLKKLILGVIQEFPHRQSYIFLDKSYQFNNPVEPWSEYHNNSSVYIKSIEESKKIDFVGIKVGDVNNNLNGRNSQTEYLNYRIEDNSIKIYSDFECEALSIFLSLNFGAVDLKNFQIKSTSDLELDYNIINGELRILINSEHLFKIEKGMPLISIELPFDILEQNQKINLELNSISHIVNRHLETISLRIKENNNNGFNVLAFGPNPVKEEFNILIKSSTQDLIYLNIINNAGQTILNKPIVLSERVNSIKISKSDFNQSGLYIVKLISKNGNWYTKVFNQ